MLQIALHTPSVIQRLRRHCLASKYAHTNESRVGVAIASMLFSACRQARELRIGFTTVIVSSVVNLVLRYHIIIHRR